jgi:hypothetical protein
LAVLEQEAKMPTFFNLDKKRKHEEQEEYDLVQMGKVDDAIMEREITIALGRNRFDVNFKNITGTFEQFLKHILGNFQQGEKDGQCILQGALVDNGGQRKAKSMTGNCILMLDIDTGVSITDLEGKLISISPLCVVWNTHSHGAEQTEIAESAFVR